MKKGDLVWVIPEKKHGIITQTMPPTVLFPAEFVTVKFFDDARPEDYLKRLVKVISSNK